MKPSEFLAELRRRLKSSPRAWGKGNPSYPLNDLTTIPRCVLGWARTIEPESTSGAEWTAFRYLRSLVGSVIEWNDSPHTTLWDVLAVLGYIQRQLEAEGQ